MTLFLFSIEDDMYGNYSVIYIDTSIVCLKVKVKKGFKRESFSLRFECNFARKWCKIEDFY